MGICKKILVIDDEHLIAWSIRRLFEKAGAEVKTAESVAEARQALEQSSFDLIIADDRLPDGSGEELLRGIRSARTGAVCVLMSGSPTIAERAEGAADGFIEKPFLLSELRAKVDACFSAREQ